MFITGDHPSLMLPLSVSQALTSSIAIMMIMMRASSSFLMVLLSNH